MARNKGGLSAINNTDLPNYPNGRLQDGSGSTSGTPVNEFVYGDIHEFFSKIMRLYGIVYNGIPDNETNGYQLIESIQALASKNDFLLSLTTNGGLLSIPVKLSLVTQNESFTAIATVDKTTETQIFGSLDTSPSSFAVTYKGGDFKTGEYLRVVKTVAGVDIIRLSDGDALQTIARDFGFLIAATLVEERAGAIDTRATTPLTNFTTFVYRINGGASSSFLSSGVQNGLMSVSDKNAIDNLTDERYGTFTLGDVGAGIIGNIFVSDGNIQQAQLTDVGANFSKVTITLDSAMADTNYQVSQDFESLGTIADDANVKTPVFKIVSSSQFEVYYEQFTAVTQNLKLHLKVRQR